MTTIWDPSLVSEELLGLTRSLGRPQREMAILAEGNTSQWLGEGRFTVKASGSNMASATANDFVVAEVEPLIQVLENRSSTQDDLTEALDAGVHNSTRRRGSIEASIHAAVHAVDPTGFVAHTHPTAVVSVLASIHAAEAYEYAVYSDEAVVVGAPLFVPYAQPGIDLGRLFYRRLREYSDHNGQLPSLILLQNHGIAALGPSVSGVEAVSEMAVKGAQVRIAAYSMGGVSPIPAESMKSFFARTDITERRQHLSGVFNPETESPIGTHTRNLQTGSGNHG
ncbi:class II aldolase/adducin family protein [Arthrobacter sp. H14]|uniref:class II aldolase/adducin family protein n=1 Tax=Arthrobacter sp. H14 TaxID=1312959 RepID=UPI0004B32328|nr:class II aldolase/adducin family protein [Arthrobacter sp. H14]